MKHDPNAATVETISEGGVTKGAVAQHLRARIVAGEFPPGARLPPRSTLEQLFGTTKVTVQRAFNDLSDDGFIAVKGKQGTFVAEAPPHLTRYGVLFPKYPESTSYISRFWSALAAESDEITKSGPRTMVSFYGMQEGISQWGRNRLHHEIRTHQLAGIIYVYNPGESDAETHKLLERFAVPRIAITHSSVPIAMPAISIDYASFFDGALDEIAARGKERVAIMFPNTVDTQFGDHVRNALSKRGLSTKPYWWLPMNLGIPASARPFTHLLMNPDQNLRPDALIVADDNLLDEVVLGLDDAGVRLPDDLLVVGHTNFPTAPAPYHGSMKLLGFDVPRILEQCLNLLERQRRGEPVPAITKTPAVFGVSPRIRA